MTLTTKWTPRWIAARVRDIMREPADLVLAIRIGFFLWRAPYALGRRHVHAYLRELERRRPRSTQSTDSQIARIERIRQAWLRRSFFRKRDSCYLRALTLYRFLDAGDEPMQLHFGVEERLDVRERRRAHVWISIGTKTYEGPPATTTPLREVTLSQVPA